MKGSIFQRSPKSWDLTVERGSTTVVSPLIWFDKLTMSGRK